MASTKHYTLYNAAAIRETRNAWHELHKKGTCTRNDIHGNTLHYELEWNSDGYPCKLTVWDSLGNHQAESINRKDELNDYVNCSLILNTEEGRDNSATKYKTKLKEIQRFMPSYFDVNKNVRTQFQDNHPQTCSEEKEAKVEEAKSKAQKKELEMQAKLKAVLDEKEYISKKLAEAEDRVWVNEKGSFVYDLTHVEDRVDEADREISMPKWPKKVGILKLIWRSLTRKHH